MTRIHENGWPSVSVVTPTYGRPQLLRLAVQSILDQRYPGEIEALVVFDREEPVPPEVRVPPGRSVRLLSNDRTPGPAGAYNVGALAATGRYLALCDDDDEWLQDKIRLQVELLERRPEAMVAACGIYAGDAPSTTRNPSRIPDKEELTVDDLLNTARNALHSSTFVVRRGPMLERVGLMDEAIPGSYGEDFDWLLRAARVAPVVALRRPLVRVRWGYSYFSERWQTIIDSLTYQLAHSPEFPRQPANLARVYGRMAFAHAALGHRDEARAMATRSIRLRPTQPRGYLALAVAFGLVRPQTVLRALRRFGRGI
jgi:glycosyltransferase involved in cell wall biosynthesis